jgi:VIT1/CCC1 family predicted Fe2+/Mn2+ transporter
MLRRELEQRLATIGIPPEQFPDAWQFVVFDVPAVEEQNPLRAYAHDSYVGLSPVGVSYGFKNGIDDQLSRLSNVQADYAQWRPNPDQVHVNIATGAGQFRGVGRVVTAYSLDAVGVPALKRAYAALGTDQARDQLEMIARQLDMSSQPGSATNAPIAVIVSSLSGGAGSGIFMDVADALRRMSAGDKWLQESIGILYDPTIFSNQLNFNNQGLAPNALAAVSELIAGHWNPWSDFPYLPSLSAPPGDKRGPMYPMLFGRDNGTVNLANPEAVYEMVADILANLTMAGEVANSFRETLMGNWGNLSQGANKAPRIHNHAATRLLRPFSSVGFARVSLGRDRFTRYAGERMTRELALKLLLSHRNAVVDGGNKSEAEVLAELMGPGLDDGLVGQFLLECGLHEGTSRRPKDQVIEALYDESQVTAQVAVAQEYVRKKVTIPRDIGVQIGNCFKAEDKTKPVSLSSRNGRKSYDAEALRFGIIQRAQAWADDIQETVLDVVTRWVVIHGIPVTLAVLKQVVETLGTTFSEDLRHEADQMQEGPSATVAFLAELAKAKLSKGSIPSTLWSNLIDPWVTELLKTIDGRYRREVAAALLVDMSKNFMQPIVESLSESLTGLRQEYASAAFSLLSDSSVPETLQPAKNVKLLESVERYPERYLELLVATSGSLEEALLRAFGSRSSDGRARSSLSRFDQAWTTDDPWVPNLVAVGGPTLVTPARLRPSFGFGLGAIEARAIHWLRDDPTSPIGAYVSQKLNGYLSEGTDTTRADRARDFASLLSGAINASKPFVELDAAWMSKFGYDITNTISYSLSKIPLSSTVKSFQIVDSVVKQIIPDSTDRLSNYDAQSGGDVEIFCFRHPFPASGALSLTDPIIGSFQVAAANGNMAGFWDQRRSRPLRQAIPLTYAAQLSTVRGWITALLLDLIVVDEKNHTCTLLDGGKSRALLAAPVGESKSLWDWLGMAMESALLAEMLMDQNEGFDTLEFIASLGCPGSDVEISASYGRPNYMLDTTTPKGLKNLKTADGQVPADIRDALTGLINACKNLRVSTSPLYAPVPYVIQLAPLIVEAAEQILERTDLIGIDEPGVPSRVPGSGPH